jgi:hypothetical protein
MNDATPLLPTHLPGRLCPRSFAAGVHHAGAWARCQRGGFYRLRVLEGGVQGVGGGVGLEPDQVVQDPEPQALQREPEVEDDVVGTRNPQRAVGLEDAPGFCEPAQVELVVPTQALRANRVTMSALEFSGVARRQRRNA